MGGQGDIRRFSVDANGIVSGLNVIGIHGFLSDRRTPAVRKPVYQTNDGRLAQIQAFSFNTTAKVKAGKRHRIEVGVKVADTILGDDEELPGNGTRVGPWRARCMPSEGSLVVVGSYERACAAELACKASRPKVKIFFQQLVSGYIPLPGLEQNPLLVAEKQGGTVWYTSWEDKEDLFRVIRDYALGEVINAVKLELDQDKQKAMERLAEKSWWLLRASFDNDHQYFAVAGLRRTGVDLWSQVLKAGLPTCSEKELEDGLKKAEEILCHFSKMT